jgi:hypothetical protein
MEGLPGESDRSMVNSELMLVLKFVVLWNRDVHNQIDDRFSNLLYSLLLMFMRSHLSHPSHQSAG